MELEKRKRGRPRLTPEERKARGSLVPRVKRPELSASHPLHITLRTLKGVPNLRTKKRFKRVRAALKAGAERFGMRLVQFAVMRNHLHLIVEAHDKESLTRGMQGLAIRSARATNRGERKGKVFRDRYHAVVLDTPRQVRNALAYVLLNGRRHEAAYEPQGPARAVDPCSSAYWFDGWSRDVEALKRVAEEAIDMPIDPPVARARTWLLTVGWRQARRIDPSEIPGAARMHALSTSAR